MRMFRWGAHVNVHLTSEHRVLIFRQGPFFAAPLQRRGGEGRGVVFDRGPVPRIGRPVKWRDALYYNTPVPSRLLRSGG